MSKFSHDNIVSFSLPVFAFLLSIDRSVLCIQEASNKENHKNRCCYIRLVKYFADKIVNEGPVRESNPGPLAPKARIMPLDQQARHIRNFSGNCFIP